MLPREIETAAVKLLAVGVPTISLFLVTANVTDPVNVTKMFIAGGVGFASLFLFLVKARTYVFSNYKIILVAVTLFLAALITSVLGSNLPWQQNLYGIYGRNNGLLTYLSMVAILICSLLVSSREGFLRILKGFLVTGLVNIIYCAWVIAFGDFIGWYNPYGNILGLFGNPDFISAFLGIYVTVALVFVINSTFKRVTRFALFLSLLLALFEVYKSHAQQGLIVCAVGAGVVFFFKIRERFKSALLAYVYLIAGAFILLLAVLGTLQKGPFDFLYKRSVSLRGSYWKAAINTGLENGLHGVGLDGYGDWYRRSRPPVALVDMPGAKVVSNVAHNVVLDFFANGGWPLLISYCVILLLSLYIIFQVSIIKKNSDPIFVAICAAWVCFEVQSIISINQIGLMVWGWLFTGMLFSYHKIIMDTSVGSKPNESFVSSKLTKRGQSTSVISANLVIGVGALVGLLISYPPLSSDMKWKSSIDSKNVNQVKQALSVEFFNPPTTQKYVQGISLLSQSGFNELALKYALQAVHFNSESTDSWKILYLLPNSTTDQKALAMRNLKRLDPLNPDVIGQ